MKHDWDSIIASKAAYRLVSSIHSYNNSTSRAHSMFVKYSQVIPDHYLLRSQTGHPESLMRRHPIIVESDTSIGLCHELIPRPPSLGKGRGRKRRRPMPPCNARADGIVKKCRSDWKAPLFSREGRTRSAATGRGEFEDNITHVIQDHHCHWKRRTHISFAVPHRCLSVPGMVFNKNIS